MTTTSSSCPGKVLILGGYAVLERPNSGLVLAVDSRFRCEASWILASTRLDLRVESPQWSGWVGEYVYDAVTTELIPLTKDRNAYVEKPLAWTLSAAMAIDAEAFPRKNECLVLRLIADNDFYSQQESLRENGLERTSQGLRMLEKNCRVRNKAAKTGLGSSAAMISSICSCLLAHLVENRDDEFAHRVAQVCHAAVQGKIGSGFDVCTAFHGSMRYMRYDAEPLGKFLTILGEGSGKASGQALLECCSSAANWNHQVEPCALPEGIELMCGDVAGGSETPSMSKQILDWRGKSDGKVWNELICRNDQARGYLTELRSISVKSKAAYDSVLKVFGKLKNSEWKTARLEKNIEQERIASLFIDCNRAFSAVRESLRLVGQLSGVPVEPLDQQALCDATLLGVPGVLACGVPGAGGFDAVFALVLGTSSKVESFWEAYKGGSVCPLLLRESKSGKGVIVEHLPPALKKSKV